MQPDDLIPATEAAAILGCHVSTVSDLANAGTLPVALKLPGKTGARLFERTVVLALAEGQPASDGAA